MKYTLSFLIGLLASSAFALDALYFKETKPLAENGHAEAQYYLGVMYDHGFDVTENDAKAVKWYREAAEQGHIGAQLNLGLMYAAGQGIPENSIRAYVWWSVAKAQGSKTAAENIQSYRLTMTKNQIAEAQTLATKCYESNYKDCD